MDLWWNYRYFYSDIGICIMCGKWKDEQDGGEKAKLLSYTTY